MVETDERTTEKVRTQNATFKKKGGKKRGEKGDRVLVIALAEETRQTSHSRANVIAGSSKVIKRW